MKRSGSANPPPRSDHPTGDPMRKTAAARLILGLAWIGYIAWPIYELRVLARAVETRDVDRLTRRIYFDAVRMSLTNQVIAAYVRRTGFQINPRAQHMS